MTARPNRVLKALIREHGLSARALADAVNTAETTLFGAPGNATDRQVRRWLSGEVDSPHLHYVVALANVLDVPAHRLGFTLTETRSRQVASALAPSTLDPETSPEEQESDPVLRRGFMIATAGNLFDFALAPLPRAGRIGMGDVAHIRDTIDRLYAVDDTYGGRQLASVAERYAALIAETMGRCSYGPNVEKALYRVRGELHACAGWFAFDSSDHPRAERNFAEGLRDALLAADGMLQARIWSYMARQSWELGRATETVTIARAALNVTRTGRDPRLSALLHGRMALGYAAAGEGARCGRSLAQADTHLDRADDTPAAWLAFVGPGELLGSAAMAHMLLGRPDHAVRHEEHGLSLLAPQFRRNRFAKLVHLSECHLAARRPDQAVHVAEQALDLYPSVDCPRWAHHLRRFRDSLTTGATTTTTAFVERHDALTAPRAETPGPWTRQH